MAKTRNYTEAESIRIQVLHEEGLSCRQIARRVRKSPTGVAALLQKLRQTGNMRDRRRTGRPRVNTARDDRNLCRMSLRDRKKTAVKLHQEWTNGGAVTASVRTIRRRLLDHGLRSCKAQRSHSSNLTRRGRGWLGLAGTKMDSKTVEPCVIV